jgi:hypothetical protein
MTFSAGSCFSITGLSGRFLCFIGKILLPPPPRLRAGYGKGRIRARDAVDCPDIDKAVKTSAGTTLDDLSEKKYPFFRQGKGRGEALVWQQKIWIMPKGKRMTNFTPSFPILKRN